MRYIELLENRTIRSNISEFTVISDQEAADLIKGDYSQASQVNLYRGVASLSKLDVDNALVKVRGKRRPLTSMDIERNAFNDMMELKGQPFRKENTTSVSTSKTNAYFYGKVYKAIPKNGTLYAYSNLKDFLGFLGIESLAKFAKELGIYDELIEKHRNLTMRTIPKLDRDVYEDFLSYIWDKNKFTVTSDVTSIPTGKQIEVIFIPTEPYLIVKD